MGGTGDPVGFEAVEDRNGTPSLCRMAPIRLAWLVDSKALRPVTIS
jgi:hypothetical protein